MDRAPTEEKPQSRERNAGTGFRPAPFLDFMPVFMGRRER